MKHQKLIEQMTLEEKIEMVSGADMWHTKPIERLGIKNVMMTDGPHGLRKIADESEGLYGSVKSTCFPPAALAACSWDEELMSEVGSAIAQEALEEQVSIVLGPGANIKRSPLCGRNFEYFSEDPLLAGKMAAGWIAGLERLKISSSLKHFAVNNQENMRMSVSAEIDERSMREIYLRPFELAIKVAKPTTIMCAYNRINGEYCANSRRLLTDILRKEWGFKGLVMSDWGAVDDRVAGIHAGMDLEMPGSRGYYDGKVEEAIYNGQLDIADLNQSVDRVLSMVERGVANIDEQYRYDREAHYELAERVASESAVLLKNDGVLPLAMVDKVLVVGELAKQARYQGGGSSHISPSKVVNLLEGLDSLKVEYDYTDGYTITDGKNSKKIREQATIKAKEYDTIVLAVGLTDQDETEGRDRVDMDLPSNQRELISAITALDKRVVVVLYGGSPMTLDFEDRVSAILMMYLPGQMGGEAAAKLLFGKSNPCGKLAETFPRNLADTPCYGDFNKRMAHALYTEGIYVGYRYYDSAKIDVRYPFGHGMSYSKFGYHNLAINDTKAKANDILDLTMTLSNDGDIEGREIIQVYIRKTDGEVFSPYQELKAFKKINVQAKSSVQVSVTLDTADWGYYDIKAKRFLVEGGRYEIAVGASSRDIRGTIVIELEGDKAEHIITDSWYNSPSGNDIPMSDFDKLRGYTTDLKFVQPRKGKFTMEHSLLEMMPKSFLARRIVGISGYFIRKALKVPATDTGYIMIAEMFRTSPLKKLSSSSQGAFNVKMCEGMVKMLNGKFFKGLSQLIKGSKTRQPLKI